MCEFRSSGSDPSSNFAHSNLFSVCELCGSSFVLDFFYVESRIRSVDHAIIVRFPGILSCFFRLNFPVTSTSRLRLSVALFLVHCLVMFVVCLFLLSEDSLSRLILFSFNETMKTIKIVDVSSFGVKLNVVFLRENISVLHPV